MWNCATQAADNGLQLHDVPDEVAAKLWLVKAQAHFINGEEDDALAAAKLGLALDFTKPRTKLMLILEQAKASLKRQEWDDVIALAKTGLRMSVGSNQVKAELCLLKVQAHNGNGEYDKVIRTGQARDTLVSGADDKTKGDFYLNWGIAHMKKGEWMLAVAAFQKGTAALNKKYAMRSLRADMHTLIAECYNRHPKKGKTTSGKDDAEAAAREALRLRPGSSSAQTQLKIAQGSIRPDGYRESVLSEIGGVFSRHNPCPCDDDN